MKITVPRYDRPSGNQDDRSFLKLRSQIYLNVNGARPIKCCLERRWLCLSFLCFIKRTSAKWNQWNLTSTSIHNRKISPSLDPRTQMAFVYQRKVGTAGKFLKKRKKFQLEYWMGIFDFLSPAGLITGIIGKRTNHDVVKVENAWKNSHTVNSNTLNWSFMTVQRDGL